MPRGRRGREAGANRQEEELGEESSDDAEVREDALGKEEKDKDPESKLHAALEQLSEKRASTKLAGLEALLAGLANAYSLSFLEKRSETVTEALLQIVRKGEPEAIVKSIRALCLVALTLGDEGIGAAGVFMSAWKVLDALMKDASKPVGTRTAAIEALAVLCFVGANEPEDEEKCAVAFEEIYRGLSRLETQTDGITEMVAEALEAHGFLLTAQPLRVLGGAAMDKYIKTWTALLAHQSLEVRSMAGENLALICAARFKRAEAQETELTEEDMPWLAATIVTVEELVKDSNRRTAKATRKKQRALFREILSTLVEKAEPTEEMKVGKDKLKFKGWTKVKQLGMFRATLGSGLLAHMAHNVVLRDLFADELRVSAAEIEEVNSTTEKPKKTAAFYAEAHKLQFQAKAKGRSNKAALQAGPVDD